MIKLVLIRHGESVWNKENRFTGWTDVDLSKKGEKEALDAGELLLKNGFVFDIGYTSLLKRAIRTLEIVLTKMDLLWIPIEKSWRLNERHYGALQGLNKNETAKRLGENQVHIWRRSFDIAPPALNKNDKRYPGHDYRYKALHSNDIPCSESLKDTIIRFNPYWNKTIKPSIKAAKRVVISAHGNTLRALVKVLDNISDADIVNLNIPTGMPLIYELDRNLIPLKKYYLGDKKKVKESKNLLKKKNLKNSDYTF